MKKIIFKKFSKKFLFIDLILNEFSSTYDGDTHQTYLVSDRKNLYSTFEKRIFIKNSKFIKDKELLLMLTFRI